MQQSGSNPSTPSYSQQHGPTSSNPPFPQQNPPGAPPLPQQQPSGQYPGNSSSSSTAPSQNWGSDRPAASAYPPAPTANAQGPSAPYSTSDKPGLPCLHLHQIAYRRSFVLADGGDVWGAGMCMYVRVRIIKGLVSPGWQPHICRLVPFELHQY